MSIDGYMNLQLANTEEYIDGALTGNLGEVLIRYDLVLICSHLFRCNNVLYVGGVDDTGDIQ